MSFTQAENSIDPSPHRSSLPWMTWLLVLSTVMVFLFQLRLFHATRQDRLGDALSFSPAALAQGRYWTLLTYAWAHAVAIFDNSSLFWLHITSNMVPLICLGPALEDALGHIRFLGLYLVGTVGAALGWYAFNLHSSVGMMGASGAIFALLTAAAMVAPGAQVTVYFLFILPIPMTMRVLAWVACGVELALLWADWMPEVAHLGHLAGAFCGILYIGILRFLHQPLDVD